MSFHRCVLHAQFLSCWKTWLGLLILGAPAPDEPSRACYYTCGTSTETVHNTNIWRVLFQLCAFPLLLFCMESSLCVRSYSTIPCPRLILVAPTAVQHAYIPFHGLLKPRPHWRLVLFGKSSLDKQIPWTAKRTNDSVLQEIGTDRQLLKSVMERKLRYFGHIMWRPGECLEKTVIQGCIQGSRPRGRPARSWINDILEATNCTLGQLLRLTEDRQAWREMVHSASNHQHWWRIKKKRCIDAVG